MNERFLEIRLTHRTRTGPLDMNLQMARHPIVAAAGGTPHHNRVLLDLLAGFLRPDRGRIRLAGRSLVDTDQGTWIPARKRRISLVPAGGALFPHLRVEENLAYAMRRVNAPALERFQSLVHAFNLTGLLARRPGELDARDTLFAAVTRALMPAPALLLLHDPARHLEPDQAHDDLDDLLERTQELGTPVLFTIPDASGLATHPRVVRFNSGSLDPR